MRKRSVLMLVFSALLAAAAWGLPPLLAEPEAGEPTGVGVGDRLGASREDARRRIREAEALARVKRVILDSYVENVDEKKLFYGCLRGMVRELDPHSQFLTPEEYAEINASTTGEFGGLGIEVTVRDGWLTVVTPLVGTPAFKAGVLPGDRIVTIDGEATDRLTLEEAVHKMRGRPGTKIVLGLARRGETKLLDLTIVRQIIRVDSVRIPHMIDEKNLIGYVSLTAFQADSADELARAVKELEAGGMRALVLDLRANGGGRMDAAIKVADLFLGDGTIVSTRGRPGARGESAVYRAHRLGTRPDYPLAVLVNQSSASASEIVAGALHDHHRAVLVGEKTFGKASVQTLQTVRIGDDVAGLKLTTAHYYTPSGQLIHGQGIAPDVEIPMEPAKLAEVLRRQHEKWIETNAPRKEGEEPGKGEEKPPTGEKAPGDGKPEEAVKAPEEVVDVQLEAALRALRAILVDRERGKPVEPVKAAAAAPGAGEIPLPDVPPGGVE